MFVLFENCSTGYIIDFPWHSFAGISGHSFAACFLCRVIEVHKLQQAQVSAFEVLNHFADQFIKVTAKALSKPLYRPSVLKADL
ncbi:hypothetical protein CS542_01160 [Pedobacter sp. IW39]|nr:hypothetical protein CS542_01160 [Pedobacter sp. IW39]